MTKDTYTSKMVNAARKWLLDNSWGDAGTNEFKDFVRNATIESTMWAIEYYYPGGIARFIEARPDDD